MRTAPRRRAIVIGLLLLAGAGVAPPSLSSMPGLVTRTIELLRAVAPSYVERAETFFEPAVTATKTASLTPSGFDVDADGKADPGDKIRYTVAISDATDPATGVHLADTPDANTTLVPGSIVISPLAIAETYASVGNMTLTSSTISATCAGNPLRSVTCNDTLNGGTIAGFGPLQASASATAAGGAGTSASGGLVVVNADGTFVYNPAAGFEGTDSFWYTLTSTGGVAGTDVAQVTIDVGGANGMVWFVTSAGGGTGRQANPISLNALRAINNGTGSNPAAGDTLFLFEGGHALTGPLTLLGTQKVIGQDTTATVANLAAPTALAGNGYPAVNNPTGTAVSITSIADALTLASGNTLAGFTVGNSVTALRGSTALGLLSVREVIVNTNGAGIVFNFGATIVNSPTFTGFTSVTSTGGANGVSLTNVDGTLALGSGDLNGNIGAAFNVSGGNASITYSGTIRNSASRQVTVFDKTGGTVTFSGAIGGTGTGIVLTNNDQSPGVGTITFTGGVTLNTGTSAAFTATSGGIVNVTGSGNTLTTTTGTALNVANTNIGLSGLTFLSINVNGAMNGIVLNNTGTTAGTHGGLTVTGTGTTAGSGGTIQNNVEGAVLTTTRGLSLANMNFTNANSGEGTVNNVDSTAFNLFARAALNLSGVTTASFTNLNVNGNGGAGGVQLGINGQTISDLTIANTTVSGFGNETGEGDVKLFNLSGTCAVTNSSFTFVDGDTSGGENLFEVRNDAGTLTLNVSNSTFSNTRSSTTGNAGLAVTAVTSATVTLNVTNNDFLNLKASGVDTIARDTSTTNVNITDGNTAGNGNVFDPQGGTGRAINLYAEDTAHLNFNVNRNSKIYGNGFPVINVAGINTAVIQGRINSNLDIRGGGNGTVGSPIYLHPDHSSTGTIDVSSNVISLVGNDPGILAAPQGDGAFTHSATLDVTIKNNSISIASTNPAGVAGISARAGSFTSDTVKTCADVQNNTVTLGSSGADVGFSTRELSSTAGNNLYLSGMVAGATNQLRAVNTWNGRGNAPTNSASASDIAGAAAYSAPPASSPYFSQCRTPSNSSAMLRQPESQPLLAQDSHRPGGVEGFAGAMWTRLAGLTATVDAIVATRVDALRSVRLQALSPRRVPSLLSSLFARAREGIVNGLSVSLEAQGAPPVDVDVAATLPVGKTVRVVFDVTVNTPPVAQYSNQGTVSGTNFTAVLTTIATTTGDRYDTGTVLVSSLNPAYQGESITVTATVTPTQGSTTPDGTVQFKDGGSNLGAAVTCAAGPSNTCAAQLTTTTLATGTRSITAVYGPGTNHDTSTSNTVSQVNTACTTNPIVTTNANSGAGSFRQAAIDACPGSTITFDMNTVTSPLSVLNVQIDLARNVTITGPGANVLTITGNTGMLWVMPGVTASISGLTFTNGNVTSGGGGAIRNRGTLTVSNSVFTGNTASGGGGAIENDGTSNNATLTVTNSSFSGNAAGQGGAIDSYAASGVFATMTLSNITISGNTATNSGGGLSIFEEPGANATATLTNVTITDNRADSDGDDFGTDGGGLWAEGNTSTTLRNTIVAGNFSGTGSVRKDISGTVGGTFNLIGDGSPMAGLTHGSGGNQVGSGGAPISARLAALANHGGVTQTHALLAGSPALDAGDNTLASNAGLTTDQRGVGFARERDAADADATATVDIGAFEADPTIEDISDQGANEDTPLAFTFNVGDGAITFDSISATSSDTALLPNANAVISADTASTRTLTLTPLGDQSGATTVTVTVNKTIGGTPLSMSDTFVLTVSAVNDAPTITASGGQTINEDGSTSALALTVGDVETAAASLTMIGSSDNLTLVPNASIVFGGSGASRTVTVTPAAGQSGAANITVSVNDGTTSTPTAFLLTVNDVNDTPTISDIANQAPAYGTAPTIPFTVGDEDTALTSLTVSATSSNTTLVPNANLSFSGSGGSRSITVTPAAGQTGTTTITVTVNDGNSTANDTFDVTVTAPTISIADATILEGSGGTATVNLDVTLSASSPSTVTVQYATSQATAIAGVDFTTATGTLSFLSGTTTLPVTITVTSDAATEINEWATVTLSSPTNAVLSDSSGLLTITDDDGTPEQRAALAVWSSPIGVTATLGTLTKTATLGWNAAAASSQALLNGDGSMEFTATALATRMAGLSRGNTDTDYADVDFGLYLHDSGQVYVLESGTSRGVVGTYAAGDRFAVAVEGAGVVYRKNGVLLYTSAVAPVYPLLIDTALYTPASTLTNVVLSGRMASPVIWTNKIGVTATGASLTKTAATGWNAGAASTRGLLWGDGSVAMTALETTTTRMFGLNADNASVDWSDLDFGLYLYSNGTIYIVESGITRGVFGAYNTGDHFQVAIESGVVVYRQNGLLLYTSAVAPTFPLHADAALYTTGATLSDVALTGDFAREATFTGGAGVTISASTLTNNGTAGSGWTAGAVSTRALVRDDGFVEFTTLESTTAKLAGLSHGNTDHGYADIDFGVLLAANATVYVFEGGAIRGVFGGYEAGDRFRVAVESGVVKYRKNGVLLYTSAVAPVSPLLVDTSLYTTGATIADVVQYGELGEAVTWTATTNVTAVGNALTKTGAPAWNAGAISTREIASGDGYVTFTTSEANTHKLVGLSVGNTNADYADVDFGILLAANGTFYVFEGGVSRGVFSTYVAGDHFAVAVEAGAVKYQKNGVTFYTSGVAPAYPLLVDTALFTVGATFTDVVLGCVSTGCQ